jgi:hypothetical protein
MRILAVVFLACLFVACCPERPIPSDTGAYVGVYAYKSMDKSVDKATDHELDHLALNADGRYTLVQGGSTKARSETTGTWAFVAGAPPNIELDHHGYPIELKDGHIRLLINNDLGEWYAKLN